MTMHDETTERLSDYLDDELTPDERARVDAHLAGCAECRLVLEDLRRIVAAAGRLPGSLPERELWDGVAERIGAPGRIVPFQVKTRRLFSFTAPQLAAAGIVLMLLSGGLVYMIRLHDAPATTTIAGDAQSDGNRILPVSLSDPQYDGAVADLERTLQEGRGRLDPETVRVLEQNIEAIDTAIEQCRRALENDPANTFLNSHLVSARQRKLALLRRATALTTGS
jgi:anti-sigma factor RsiW